MNATPPLLPSRSSADRLPSATARLGWIPTWIVGRRYYQASPTPDDGLTAAGAAQRVARILADLKFDGLDADETPCLASQPGLEGGDIDLHGAALAYLRLRLNEPAFVAGRQPEIPAPGPAEDTAEPSDSSSDASARTGIGITLFRSFVCSFLLPFLPA